ncbi:MutS domain V domain containing protein [Naviculisporaceae sp. PSN 640]
MATLNLTTGAAEITRIVNDDKFEYQRLIALLNGMEEQPTCFIVLRRLVNKEGQQSPLYNSLAKAFPDKALKGLDRRYWSASEGLQLVRKLALEGEREAIVTALDKNFYAACAFSAVIEYASHELGFDLAPGRVHIKYGRPSDALRLDHVSVASLELLQSARDGRAKASSLFAVLDKTETPQGRRLLRSALLQPSTLAEEITARQEAVEEFVSREQFRSDVCSCLKALHRMDIERVVSWILRGDLKPQHPLTIGPVYARHGMALACHDDLREAESDLNNLLMLNEYLDGVAALHSTLVAEGCSSGLGQWLEEQLAPERLATTKGLLALYIDDHARSSKRPVEARNNRLWAMRAPPNSSLEKARLSYKDASDALDDYVDALKGVLGDYLGKEGKLSYDADHRYSLSFPTSEVTRALGWAIQSGSETQFEFQLPAPWSDQIPGENPVFTATRKPNCFVFQTRLLFQYSQRTQLYADLVTSGSDEQVMALKQRLRQIDLTPLYEMSDAVAILDMICSFAFLAASRNYVRPKLSDHLVLQGARNPIVETRRPGFTPNDLFLGVNSHRCLVITGGNMSGKSTFVKMVALIQIMAQMGSFVPATYADVPICDQILTRLSTEDNPENNLGTFAVEMSDMNLILRHATENSLVIIDELGRGTSHSDGLSLAMSMCLKLLEAKARTVFATHFTEIGPYLRAKKEDAVTCVHFDSKNVPDPDNIVREVNISHTLMPGPIRYQDYGVDLASRFLPQAVVNCAGQVSAYLLGTSQSEGASPRLATADTIRHRLFTGMFGVLTNLQHQASAIPLPSLAREVQRLQIAAREMEEGVAGPASTPRSVSADAPSPRSPMTSPGLRNLLSGPQTGPSAEQRERWAREEHRVMAANTLVQPGTKRPKGKEREVSTDEIERPRKVFRGSAAGSSRAVTTEPEEFTRELDAARNRLREWEREDNI